MDINTAKEKLIKYCSYQERSHLEAKTKLYSLGLKTYEVNEVLLYLVQENYLNEERFALHYAGSKMRQKNWGKTKIAQSLKLKGISPNLIKQALQQLDTNRYDTNIIKLLEKKYLSLKSGTEYERKQKTTRYLLSKGYAYAEIEPILAQFLNSIK